MSATPACRIHLVRHGTTTLNVENRYRGRLDVPLDAEGWEDARRAARQLANEGLVAVYSSPLQRARDTAQTVADAAGVPEIVDSFGLINLDYGQWDALTSDEAAAHDPEAYARYQTFEPGATCPGGENLDDAAARVVDAIREIGARHPGQQVGAVSHAAMVRLALAMVSGTPRSEWRRSLPNGSITVFEVQDGRVTAPDLFAETA
jgi:broad specificity phosphatase PhoE